MRTGSRQHIMNNNHKISNKVATDNSKPPFVISKTAICKFKLINMTASSRLTFYPIKCIMLPSSLSQPLM